jgi:predicted nucleotidyltransferase
MKTSETVQRSQNIRMICDTLAADPRIKFAYLFGSQADGKTTSLSDTDIAVYLDRRMNPFTYRLKLMEILTKKLKSENIDLVVLNTAPPLLKYAAIKNNYVLKENGAQRIPFEIRVLQEFLDTDYLRQTQRQIIREQIKEGKYFG